MTMIRKLAKQAALTVALMGSVFTSTHVSAEGRGMTEVEIDTMIEGVMDRFHVPGASFGLIKDGKIVVSKGYGVLEVGNKKKVDDETLFAIASNSKAFTAASLAMLVDEGKLDWNDKVIDHIPGFRLFDPWVTREFRVIDLLIHNSGLGLGAGDLMFWPSPGFTREEIIHGLRYLKPVSTFRSEYAYDNLLYIVAGEVIKVVSGLEYETFVQNRIMKPIGMKHCAAERASLKGHKNVAEPHLVMEGELEVVSRIEGVSDRAVSAAAGGLLCSTKSLLKWVEVQLNDGKLPDGTPLISAEQQLKMETPQTIMPLSDADRENLHSNFKAYGLGFRMQDVNGYKWVAHKGGLLGMVSYVGFIPSLDIGFVFLTNQMSPGSVNSVAYTILEAYTTDERTDWISHFDDYYKTRIAETEKLVPDMSNVSYEVQVPLDTYVGTYQDPWFGNVDITMKDGTLYFASNRQARLKGEMVPFKSDIFIVRWDERALGADAYVNFSIDYSGLPSGFAMQAVSPLTDFSFDFHDLDFTKVGTAE